MVRDRAPTLDDAFRVLRCLRVRPARHTCSMPPDAAVPPDLAGAAFILSGWNAAEENDVSVTNAIT